jgi:hypothetical protein
VPVTTSGFYMDRKGLKTGTPLPAVIALSSALGSPRSSPGLIVVEVDLVMKRSGVLGTHDVDGLRGQALEFLDLSVVKLEPRNTLYLTQLLRPPICQRRAPASVSPVRGSFLNPPVGCQDSVRSAFR